MTLVNRPLQSGQILTYLVCHVWGTQGELADSLIVISLALIYNKEACTQSLRVSTTRYGERSHDSGAQIARKFPTSTKTYNALMDYTSCFT
ncbi:hypothetical protein SFRURICE_014154 [Spodoptera frugiperda]|nr:hypothetical protein SFRURICE_014154 [Spodoptera frugiperda]